MARPPRPVDPDEGPLQAFAFDLRKLREKAGTPTYRTLARKAGYSPATLSEAARGQRRPSLDVTTAYVGACGGDPDEWRLRWHDLPAPEPKTPAERVAVTVPAAPARTEPPAEPAPRRPRWRRSPVVTALVVLVALAAVTGAVALVVPWPSGGPSPDRCPRATGTGFPGQTYVFTRARRAAMLSAPVARTMPAGCTVVFSGYCLGDTVTDETSHTPDLRWFELTGGGLVSSAIVHGNPPPRLAPSTCPGGATPPRTIHLNVRRSGSGLRLQAGGQGVRIIGFTARDTDEPGSRWHQISTLISTSTSTAELRWQPRGSLSPSRHLTVAAVACLGGDGPTTVIAAQDIHPGDRLRTTPTPLSGKPLDAATHSACQYPNPADLPGSD